MKRIIGIVLAASVLCLGAVVLIAQNPPAGAAGQRGAQAPAQPMSFFITSVGKGDGANYGGLAGADAYCQSMAAAAGRGGAMWHAYLSTQGAGAVNARDRIGAGPWYNARGQRVAMNVAELHGDTIEQARIGNALGKQFSLTEKNTIVNGVGDMPNQHDILTGSRAMAAPIPTPTIIRAATTRATPMAGERSNSDTPTNRAATTVRGTPRMPAAAAVSRIWWRRVERDCCTASRRTRLEGLEIQKFWNLQFEMRIDRFRNF